MNSLFKLGLLSVLVISASGCASIITSNEQTVTFTSEPEEATVSISGRTLGKTPFSMKVKRGKKQFLTFKKEGYKTYTTEMPTTVNSWFWGNILFGGLLGSTTDNASGAIHEYTPDQYFVTLTPDGTYGISNSKPRMIKEIIVAFSDDIRLELASSSGGEKTDSILSVIGTNNDAGKDMTLKVLQKLATENENDMAFAEAIIEFYKIE